MVNIPVIAKLVSIGIPNKLTTITPITILDIL